MTRLRCATSQKDLGERANEIAKQILKSSKKTVPVIISCTKKQIVGSSSESLSLELGRKDLKVPHQFFNFKYGKDE